LSVNWTIAFKRRSLFEVELEAVYTFVELAFNFTFAFVEYSLHRFVFSEDFGGETSYSILFGTKKDIEKRIRKQGIGCKINTSQMERLNATIRGQQARLIRRTRSGSHRQELLQYSIWLWRDLYNWTRVHYSLCGLTLPRFMSATYYI